jgi:hypothetical protein
MVKPIEFGQRNLVRVVVKDGDATIHLTAEMRCGCVDCFRITVPFTNDAAASIMDITTQYGIELIVEGACVECLTNMAVRGRAIDIAFDRRKDVSKQCYDHE